MTQDRITDVYEQIARRYDLEGENQIRDRFLLLAACAAHEAGAAERAEQLRERILARNPHHLLEPFESFAEASEAPDVITYVEGLRRTYPPEQAESMLTTLEGGKLESLPITLRSDKVADNSPPIETVSETNEPAAAESHAIPSEIPPGRWIVDVLRVVVIVLGLALLVYTLAHP